MRQGAQLDENQTNFLISCFEQNLEHVRHVENERLTFTSIYMALVGGALAFIYSTDVQYRLFSIVVTGLLIMTGIIAMMLTKRWDNTFDRHLAYAMRDYKFIHKSLFPGDLADGEPAEEEPANLEGDWAKHLLVKQEYIEGIDTLPAYCFRPVNPPAMNPFSKAMYKIRTRRLFFWFYVLIQLVLISSLIYFIVKAF